MKVSSAKYFLVAPPLLFFLALSLIPLLLTLGLSLTDADLSGAGNWIGLSNYKALWSDRIFLRSYLNTLEYAVIGVPVQYVLGLVLAVFVAQFQHGRRLLRLIVLIPLMVAPLVVGFIWKTMLDSRLGPVDDLLRHLTGIAVPWLTDETLAFVSILVVDTWQWTPFMFLILFAGIASMPREPFEAAYVDGASRWRVFWDITFPMLGPASLAAVLLRGIEAFKIFDIVYYITGGGPGSVTTSTTLTAYFTGLRSGHVGYGAAMTVILLLTVIAFGSLFPFAVKLITRQRGKTFARAVNRNIAATNFGGVRA
ncbi:MAG TPA: sugar ABC transporter permease [Nitrobacter sp.]|jgi:multiple sugar transport system permease protein|nr:sugar ABC transporter permease [Nitrobacter sp.]